MFAPEILLKWIMRLIYCLLAAILFYFPLAALAEYFALKTHFLATLPTVPVEDSLLSLLGLAMIYAAVAKTREKMEKADSA